MEKKIIIGSYTWDAIVGVLSVTVQDIAPSDWKTTTTPEGFPVAPPKTIKELKQQLGGIQGSLVDPISGKKFVFDLSPWMHLDEDTHLQLTWSFKPDHPIPSHVTSPWRKPHSDKKDGI